MKDYLISLIKKIMEKNQEYKESFEKVVKPVIKWLSENRNPHCSIEITSTCAELKSGELCYNLPLKK